MTIARLFAILVTGALFAAGCGEDRGATSTSTNPTTTTTSTGEAEGEIEVGLKEWAVVVEAPSVGSGEVTFKADNEGKVPHELVVLKTDTKAADLETEGTKAKEEGENLGKAANVAPGTDGEVKVELESGHYVLLCNLPGHFQQGMATDLDIE
jgi:uncharacterized cupredoxin-like copper-binding protein